MIRKLLSRMRLSFIVLAVNIFLFACSKKDQTLTIGFAGDILLDRGVRKEIEKVGYEAFYARLDQQLPDYDLMVANLECPLTEVENPVFKKYIFRGDTINAYYLKKVGFTHLSMANNHSYDQGRDGLSMTASVLRRAGIESLGYGENKENACQPVQLIKNGFKVALFATVSLSLENWFPLEEKTCICQENASGLAERIAHFRKSNPDHYIIATIHWGIEHITEPSPQQKQMGRQLIDAGADAIIGHHPHVLQDTEMYKGKLIAYSLGNLIFDQRKEMNRITMIKEMKISKKGVEYIDRKYEIQDCIPVKQFSFSESLEEDSEN